MAAGDCGVRVETFVDQKIAKLIPRFFEQQQRQLKDPGALLGSLAGTAVHRGRPVGLVATFWSCERRP